MESCREIFSSAARKARPSQRFLRHAATMRGATARLYRSRPDRHRRSLRRRRCPRANAFDARRAATQIVAAVCLMNDGREVWSKQERKVFTTKDAKVKSLSLGILRI